MQEISCWAYYQIKVSVFKEMLIPTATPGRAHFLLKKGAKLRRTKAEHKKYPANLKLLKSDPADDEEEDKNEMN